MVKLAIAILAAGLFGSFLAAKESKIFDNRSTNDVLKQALNNRARLPATANAAEINANIFHDADTINILFLGLDSRAHVTSTRCDAIHMLSLNVKDWTIEITSVPRGTYTYIKGYPQNSSYMANACHALGVDGAKKRIEKLINIKADYTVTIGFSQTYGVLRLLRLPAVQSLQWLRNRKTFLIGDPQRSHNQALFIKDLALKYVNQFGRTLTVPLERVALSFVNTDLDFATFHALLQGYRESGLARRPERIRLSMKPYYKTKDYHFDFSNPDLSLKAIGISKLTTTNVVKNNAIQQTEQQKIISLIRHALKNKKPLKDIIKKQLWRQVEDGQTRESLHFAIVKRRVTAELSGMEEKIEFLSDYIMEKETLELNDWAEKGKNLMAEITN